MNKEEIAILHEIKEDIRKILDLLENPNREIKNERKDYIPKVDKKREFVIKDPDSPATQGQKDFLLSKEYNGDVDNLTKGEASKIIDAYIKSH